MRARQARPVASEPFGVYLHVPFCARRCGYCAFATYSDRDHLQERYVAAVRAETAAARAAGELPVATSVFIGGGTPSRLPADALCSMLDGLALDHGAEVTVECNPEDASAARFAAWRRAGVTRVSFGIQSTNEAVLFDLERRHRPGDLEKVATLVHEAGFESWNVDLIFGAASERDADWRATLDAVVSLDNPPPHVAAYALTVEAGTPLARRPAAWPDEDAQARRYLLADSVLASAGYVWEEISNWARPGHECRHHALYWSGGDYRGFGSAAHSHRRGRRFFNVRTPERYLKAIEEGRSPLGGEEVLGDEQRAFETLALSLRTPAGVPASSFDHAALCDELVGLVVRRGDRVVLSPKGRLLFNEVAARLRPTPSEAHRVNR